MTDGHLAVMMDSRRSSGLAAVAAATAAVFVAGRRAGSAVLVGERCLLTAAHVLPRDMANAGVTPGVIEVQFPITSAGGAGARVSARRVVLDAVAAGVDVGMLDLAPDARQPGWPPAAVPLWPARRLPGRVSVFGFPREEKALRGVWRTFDIVGPAADGTVQLDWAGEVGTLQGHSGGPVADPQTGALVGILVHGSQVGRFDRFVPVTVIGQFCPGLPFPWLMAGTDARSHFTRRSRGQRSHGRGGDLFRGRAAALAAVTGWLTAPDDQGRLQVVTGQPGAGKSAVLARAALDLEAGRTGPGLAFHAHGATHDDLLAAVADLTGAEHARSRGELLETLEDQPLAERVMIAVDALDEAASGPDRREIAGTLTELAKVPRMRVAVATRSLSAGHRYNPGELLPALGISSADSAALVDLDTDRYFDPEGLRQFAAAVLTQHQSAHPGPAGAAWNSYRADPGLCDRLTRAITSRADRNYLVAAMAAVQLSGAEQPVDPAAPGFDAARIPTGVNEALATYLDLLPEPQQLRTRALLTALAYARGGGADDCTWMAFTSALGYPVSTADLDQLRTTMTADYLLQSVPDDSGPVTRLFHQALADELLAPRHQPSDERALLDALRPAPGMSWGTATGYTLTYAADHASSARQLLTLLDDPDYLTHADLTRLPALLSLDPDTTASPIAVLVRQVAARANPLPPPRRARLLALAAAHFGLPDLRRRFADAWAQPFIPVWAHTLGIPHMELTGHTSIVCAVAIGQNGDGDIIVSGSQDGTVRVWDAATWQPRGEPLTAEGQVYAVAIGQAGDRDIIVSGGEYGVRVWDAAARGEFLRGHTGPVRAVAIGRAGDRDLIVSGGEYGVRVWDAATGEIAFEPLTGHTESVFAVAIGRAGDRNIIVAGSRDRKIRMWDAATGQPVGGPLIGAGGPVRALAIGRAGDRDIIVANTSDNTVQVWDAATGQPCGEPLTGQSRGESLTGQGGPVRALAIGRAGDRDIIVANTSDNTVQVWDAATGQPSGEPLTGHSGWVAAVAVGRAGDRDVVVSGGWDRTVRVWDVAIARTPGEPLSGHRGYVAAVAVGRAGDRDVVVSGSWDNTVRLWDAATGQPWGEPLTGHTEMVFAVAIGRAGDGDIIVSGSDDGTVRVWDAATGQPRGELLTDQGAIYTVAIGRAGDRDIIVTGSGRSEGMKVWDAATGLPWGEPLTDQDTSAHAVAIGRVGDRDIIVVGNGHGVRVWDVGTGQPRGGYLSSYTDPVELAAIKRQLPRIFLWSDNLFRNQVWVGDDAQGGIGQPRGEPLVGRDANVKAVAIGRVGDRDVIVSGTSYGAVRVWDAVTGQPRGEPLTGHTDVVEAVEIGRVGDCDVVVSGSRDNTVRIWDMSEGGSLAIDVLGEATAVALAKDGRSLCVAAGHTICLFKA